MGLRGEEMTYVTTDAAVTVNDAAARVVAAYLDYAARVVTASLGRQGCGGDFSSLRKPCNLCLKNFIYT